MNDGSEHGEQGAAEVRVPASCDPCLEGSGRPGGQRISQPSGNSEKEWLFWADASQGVEGAHKKAFDNSLHLFLLSLMCISNWLIMWKGKEDPASHHCVLLCPQGAPVILTKDVGHFTKHTALQQGELSLLQLKESGHCPLRGWATALQWECPRKPWQKEAWGSMFAGSREERKKCLLTIQLAAVLPEDSLPQGLLFLDPCHTPHKGKATVGSIEHRAGLSGACILK